MSLLATGSAGFIESNFAHTCLSPSDEPLVNLGRLTYAGKLANFDPLKGDSLHVFVQVDIGDRAVVPKLLIEHKRRAVLTQ